ncbi:MAG TPA: ATP-binding protein, partial [Opitutus sp.]|nr:ATP-binding protein [Opitutus sp.]
PGPNAGACGSAFALRKRVVVEDTEADQCFLLFREVARAAGFRAVHSTPVLNRAGDILGIVSVHFDDPRRPSQAEMQLADMCARYAADAIESTRHQDALRESEERFRTLADSAPVLIWVNGPDQCEYVNRYYREFCGIDTVGPFDWSAVLHPEDRQAYVEAYVAAAGERSHFAAQCRVRRGSGDYRWVQSVGMPRFAPTGEWLGYVGCSVDITDLKSAGDQLREADRRKDEFLAVLAHELRNPLAPIRNGLHLLRAVDPQSSGAEQMRAMMERQVNHLVRLVDDLMELSRITTGKLELRKEPTELAAVVGSAVESSRPLMDAKGHRLRIHLPAEALRLNADPVRLAQVIANLLNNAAKYTHDRGEIVLETRRDADCAVVSVRDSGVGIPPDMLAHIFDKFTQVDTSYGRAQGGLGVGLSLARSLVELHGGSIEARSEGPGQGSEFIIRLPLAAWRNTAASVAPAVQGGARPLPHASRRILVVDDNADAADSLGMLLEHMGHQVHVVNDGESALAAARAGRPDVMFLDISMPGMDGYTVASRLRMDPRLAKTRIVAMTGHGQEDDRRKSREAGFDAHVVKPVAPESLGELLKM